MADEPPLAPTLDPPLKWAGGKRWLVPRLRDLYAPHRHRRLVEPFVGGMAVALGLMPERALLADINTHLMGFYRSVQQGLQVAGPLQNDADAFYAARARFNELIVQGAAGGAEAAGLFYYLNRTGYNGLCRFNSRGLFNVPFGRYRSINYRRDLSHYAPVLRGWDLRCCDFRALELLPDDFVYADPPYDVEFTRYSPTDFRWDDQVALADWLRAHPGPVVASNQATDRSLQLYRERGFDIVTLAGPRRISCTGDRSPALELLATRNL